MQNVSNAFRRALSEDKRDYILRATITLTSGTVLTLDNSYIWEGGFTINDAVSNDNSFQVGGAIINGASLNINNVYGTFDEYDFDNARVVMECGLSKADLETETADEYVKKGVFYVDEATYNDTYIKLSCLDNMAKFDRPYSFDGPNDTPLTYPATLGDIVQNACHNCGVTLANDSQQFPHYTYVVDNAPSGQSTTYRQVISWAAQIAGCFARCNAEGKLELRWYDILALEAQMTNLDGGYFDGVAVGWLSDYFNTDTGMDTLQSGAVDDRWFYIENTVGFTFNDNVSSRLYIDSDSCYAFVDSAPTSHGHSKRYDVNICCRDGQVDLIKYQTIDTGSRQALKVRFHGYTRYGASNATREYELEYEIFFTDSGEIVINFITLPTNSSYFGETSIIENGVTTTLTPSTDSLLAAIRTEDAWEGVPTANHYLSGDTADGGTFDPWNTGDVYDAGTFTDTNNCHLITSAFSSNISTDDVVLTGVRVVKKVKTEGSQDSFEEYTSGTAGYMVSIENNDLIQGTHGQDIADWIGDAMTGFAFRKAELSHPSDPSMEAGDVAVYFDRKNNVYPIIISSTSFTAGNSQNTHSSAETPRKNSATRYTEATREYVEMRRQLADQQTAWEDAVDDLSDRIDAAGGLYSTQVVESGATKIYYHDKPVLNESDIVMLFTTAGFTMTANYQAASPTWYGMTVDGTMIAAIMNTIGINFDWGVGGELIIRDGNNVETLYANAATGAVRINAQSVSITGQSVSSIAQGYATTAENNAKTAAQGYASAAQTAAEATAAADATDKANAAEQAAKNYSNQQLMGYAQEVSAQFDSLFETWFYDGAPTLSNPPASSWTDTETRDAHVGDLYFDTTGGFAYKFTKTSGVYSWVQETGSGITTALADAANAQDTADNKRRVFTSQPSNSSVYDVGDLWVNATYGTTYTNDILRCKTAKTASTNFNISHWELASKYTDDSALTTWLTNTYASDKSSLESQIDEKIETWYQSSDPASSWSNNTTKAKHVGDLWYCTASSGTYAGKYWQYTYESNAYSWKELKAMPPTGVMDEIDGKANIFTGSATPSGAEEGDLWFKGTTEPILTYVNGSWVEYNRYTTEINKRVASIYQAADPSLDWTTTADKAAHVGDIWYCNANPSSVIPNWLKNYVNTDTGLTALSETRVDDGWVNTANTYSFSFDGAVSSNVYINSNSIITFANTQPSSTSSSQTGNVHVCARDGQSVYIGYQNIDASTNGKALKIKYKGYTLYQVANQRPEYKNEYEIFFLNNGTIILNHIAAPIDKTYIGTSKIVDNGVTTNFAWLAGITAFTKVDNSWTVNSYVYAQQYWQWVLNGSTYEWQPFDTSAAKIAQLDESLNQEGIYNRLTNNDANQGVYLDNGKLYLNFTYAHGGTLKLGGQNAGNGVLKVYNSNNTEIATIDEHGVRNNKTSLDDLQVGFVLNSNGFAVGDFRISPSKTTNGSYSYGTIYLGRAKLDYVWSDPNNPSSPGGVELTTGYLTVDAVHNTNYPSGIDLRASAYYGGLGLYTENSNGDTVEWFNMTGGGDIHIGASKNGGFRNGTVYIESHIVLEYRDDI